MSEGKKAPSLLTPILIAAGISLLVCCLRLYGELEQWAPAIFNIEAGGKMSPLGISWLVLPFGFWFGRRLAKGGSRPRSTGLAIGLPIVGFAAVVGTFIASFMVLGEPENLTADQWETQAVTVNIAAAICGLATMIAWPRAWLALVFYGILARLPVIAIQYYSVVKGWDVHFAKGPPHMPDEMVLFALTLAQSLLWPLGWTPIAGGLFAAFGALTVGSGKKS